MVVAVFGCVEESEVKKGRREEEIRKSLLHLGVTKKHPGCQQCLLHLSRTNTLPTHSLRGRWHQSARARGRLEFSYGLVVMVWVFEVGLYIIQASLS